jgi:hypothetical protein
MGLPRGLESGGHAGVGRGQQPGHGFRELAIARQCRKLVLPQVEIALRQSVVVGIVGHAASIAELLHLCCAACGGGEFFASHTVLVASPAAG